MSIPSIAVRAFCFGLLLGTLGCKKDADLPQQLRVSDFYVRCTLTDASGLALDYAYQGGDTNFLKFGDIQYPVVVGYGNTWDVGADSIKRISGDLNDGFFSNLFRVAVSQDARTTDPFLPPEWTREELEAVLAPGRRLAFGRAPGEARMAMRFFDNDFFWSTDARSNDGGELIVLEVDDYGSPSVNVPYFGKKVRFAFNCTLYNGDEPVRATGGEAVLFYQYYRY